MLQFILSLLLFCDYVIIYWCVLNAFFRAFFPVSDQKSAIDYPTRHFVPRVILSLVIRYKLSDLSVHFCEL